MKIYLEANNNDDDDSFFPPFFSTETIEIKCLGIWRYNMAENSCFFTKHKRGESGAGLTAWNTGIKVGFSKGKQAWSWSRIVKKEGGSWLISEPVITPNFVALPPTNNALATPSHCQHLNRKAGLDQNTA